MRSPNRATAVRARAFSLCVAIALTVSCGSSRNKADEARAAADAIRQQIARYTAALDAADIDLASQVWRTSAEVSFIHPAGHARGWEEVKEIYKFFGSSFSERKLSVRDVSVHVMATRHGSSSIGTSLRNGGTTAQRFRQTAERRKFITRAGTAGNSFTCTAAARQ